MTAFGSYARLWAAYAVADDGGGGGGELVPVFPPAAETGAPETYLDLRGNEVEFGFWFAFVQTNYLPTAAWVGDLARGSVAGLLVDARNAVHVVPRRRLGELYECRMPNGATAMIPPRWRMGYVVWEGQVRQCDYCYGLDGDERMELYWAWNLKLRTG
ncbi:hypothetical protein PWT90_11267 [Aphanocladium album]|nr:hypothetical protein PWT90_11267 [Aphanocladium album]